MPYTDETLQLLSPEGKIQFSERTDEYLPLIEELTETQLTDFYRTMRVTRVLDHEAHNLQRQGQMALWVPAVGQEGCQVGSGAGARPQDTIFPAYREHSVARMRGVSMAEIIQMLRGLTHGGWNPAEKNNFRLFTLVIGSHTLHATGYAMGIGFDGASETGNVDEDEAVLVYFGDGATSQGDTNEAMVFAQSYQTPLVFFLQNNHWAISAPVRIQSRTPLYKRAEGFGIPSYQVDGNDVLINYAITRTLMDRARSGGGPQFIEALTYRIGAHTSSDDPTRYRDEDEMRYWGERDPIDRFRLYLQGLGVSEEFFDGVEQQAKDEASDLRRAVMAMTKPDSANMFANVYSDPHPLVDEQRTWWADFESSFSEGSS
jgi:2-oxoisovalerate dehydrogenase E1 component alpha subunit